MSEIDDAIAKLEKAIEEAPDYLDVCAERDKLQVENESLKLEVETLRQALDSMLAHANDLPRTRQEALERIEENA